MAKSISGRWSVGGVTDSATAGEAVSSEASAVCCVGCREGQGESGVVILLNEQLGVVDSRTAGSSRDLEFDGRRQIGKRQSR